MCYYNSISIPKGAKASFKGKTKDLPPIERPIQSGFEYGNWPIIKSQGEDDFSLALGHWELIAPWVKNTLEVMRGREKFNTLNATAERLFESKLFIQPALKRRCLVLSMQPSQMATRLLIRSPGFRGFRWSRWQGSRASNG